MGDKGVGSVVTNCAPGGIGWRARNASAKAVPADSVGGDSVVVVVGDARAVTERVRVATDRTSATTGRAALDTCFTPLSVQGV
jgi:hypothetical protein